MIDTSWFLEQASRAIIWGEQATRGNKSEMEVSAFFFAAFNTWLSVSFMVKAGMIALDAAQQGLFDHIKVKLTQHALHLPQGTDLTVLAPTDWHINDNGGTWRIDPTSQVALHWCVGYRDEGEAGWYWFSALAQPGTLMRTSSYFGPFTSREAAMADCETAHRTTGEVGHAN